MAFRDDLDAAHARVKALEAELARVDAENRRLRGGASAASAPVVRAATSDQPGAAAVPEWPPAWARWTGIIILALAGMTLGALLTVGAPIGLTLLVVGGLLALALLLSLVVQLVVTARPGELVVLSGRPRTLPDGSQVGFRLLREGRTLRIPILELAHRLDIRPLQVEVTLLSVYCSDRTPVSVQARAAVAFSRDEPVLVNAIERLLGVSRADVTLLVRDTLEHVVREVMSRLPASALAGDALPVGEAVLTAAIEPLRRYGLEPTKIVLTRRDDGVDSTP